jgi:hypothetical protein
MITARAWLVFYLWFSANSVIISKPTAATSESIIITWTHLELSLIAAYFAFWIRVACCLISWINDFNPRSIQVESYTLGVESIITAFLSWPRSEPTCDILHLIGEGETFMGFGRFISEFLENEL